MTCREKLTIEHPELLHSVISGGCQGCPSTYHYMRDPIWCNDPKDDRGCEECWGREIPEEPLAKLYHNDEVVEAIPIETPHILDSGNRTVFESGAVRDIQEGKGRCDLLPLDVVAGFLSKGKMPNPVLSSIYLFQIDGIHTNLYGALDRFCEMYFDDAKTLVLETAVHYEEGAKKYDENNWKKGIPVKRYIDSGVRHYLKFLRGDKDERHDRAFCWNMMGAIWTCKHMPELNEYRKVEEENK